MPQEQDSDPETGQPLPVVVDANILISLLIAKGSKHKLFFSRHIAPNSPEFVLFEVGKYWKRISEGSGTPEDDLKLAFSGVRLQMKIFPMEDIKPLLEDAEQLSPDKADAEYFALALKLGCPIWSEDKLLKKQSTVKVLNTPELLAELGLK